jgi:hypothetical protein
MKLGRRVLRWSALRQPCLLAGILLCAGAVSPTPTFAQPAPHISDEYQVKAAFLFNFAQFVEWPARAFPTAESPFVISILGADPFGSYLDELVKGEKVGGRPFVIRRCSNLQEAGACHILFISRSEHAALKEILHGLKDRSILTISDADAFNRYGGMVRFVMENGKIRLRIQLQSAKDANLTISSKILRPATIVNSDSD